MKIKVQKNAKNSYTQSCKKYQNDLTLIKNIQGLKLILNFMDYRRDCYMKVKHKKRFKLYKTSN